MNKKKLLALLMALVMTLTLVPVTAFAEGEASENVAMIGTNGYPSLAAAIADVPTDGTATTITMIGNEAMSTGVTVAAGMNIVLELNGHQISEDLSQSGTTALITNRGTLTIQDCTDVDKNGTGTGKITYKNENPDPQNIPGYASNTICNNGTLTIESGLIENRTYGGYAAYTVDNQTNGNLYAPVFTMNGGRLYNNYTDAVRMFLNSDLNLNKVNISGGILDSDKASGRVVVVHNPSAKVNKGELNITGGTINGKVNAWSAANFGGVEDRFSDAQYAGISINISGGKIKELSFTAMANETLRAEKLQVTGGKYTVNPSDYVSAGYKAVAISEDPYLFEVVPDVTYVAQIGEQSYATVKDAITHVADGDTINVIADSTANDILYDVTPSALKDKTVTITGSNTLTSTEGNFGFYFGDYDSGSRPSDVINVNGITLAKDGGDYNTLFDGLTANLTGVTITGNGNTALSYANGARGTLTNVTVTNTGSHAVSWRNAALTVQGIGQGPSVLTVKSGTYTSANGYAVYIFSSGGTVNIEGGTFQGALCANIDRNNYNNDYNKSIINISGGTFTKVAYTFVCNGPSAADYAKIVITGGTFDADPTNYVAAGYEAVKNNNDTWTVVPADNYVAQVVRNDIPVSAHTTLQEAIDAASAGETVKLLDDIVLNSSDEGYSAKYGFSIDKSITIDGNGKTITSGVFDRIFLVDENTTVSMKNLTVKNCKAAASDTVCVFTWNSTEVCFENVTLDTTGHATGWNQPLTISGDGNVKTKVSVNGCTIKTNNEGTDYYAILVGSPADVSVDNSTIKGWACVYLKSGAVGSTFNIANSTLVSNNIYGGTTNAFAAVMIEGDNVTVNIEDTDITIYANSDQKQGVAAFSKNTADSVVNLKEGNKVTLAGTQLDKSVVAFNSNYFDGYGKIAVTGGLFSKQVAPAYCAEGYICVDNPDTQTNTDYPYMVKQGTYVAEVLRPIEESTYYNYVGGYETLQEAVNAAQSGDAVVLLANNDLGTTGLTIAENKKIDLYLEGFDISGAVNGKLITNHGDLTIYGDGHIYNTDTNNQGHDAVCNYGVLTINGGTFGDSDDEMTNGNNYNRGAGVRNLGGTVTINGGNFTAGDNYLNGGWAYAIINGDGEKNGTITINDGAVVYGQNNGNLAANDGSIIVNGGTFSITGPKSYYCLYAEDGASISVSDGRFIKTSGSANVLAYKTGNIAITGGLYNKIPERVADGYQVIANTDETTSGTYPYTIGKVQVTEKADATVTVDVEDKVEYTGAPTTVTGNETVKSGINTNTSVSGVALTNNLVGETNGVQAVVEAAKAKEGSGLTDDVLHNATTVEVKVDVTVVPTEYTENKTFTFSLTPTATVKTTYTEDNVEKTLEVTGVAVDNDMIDKTQDIEVTLYTGFRPALLTHRDNQGNVIGSYTEGNTVSDSTFTYDTEKGTCKLIIHHFSTIEATASDSVASVDFEGGSLRRRVWIGTENVVSHETDFRMKFAFNLPNGATVIPANSYFYWSTSNTNPTASDRKIQITSINTEGGTFIGNVEYNYWAAMIIQGVPSSAFNDPIYCKMHLEYELGGKTYAVEMSANKTVKQIATGLAGLDSTVNTNLKWIAYGEYLLGDRTSYTLSEFN